MLYIILKRNYYDVKDISRNFRKEKIPYLVSTAVKSGSSNATTGNTAREITMIINTTFKINAFFYAGKAQVICLLILFI